MVEGVVPSATMVSGVAANAESAGDRLLLSAVRTTEAAVTPKLLPPTVVVIVAVPAVVPVSGAL